VPTISVSYVLSTADFANGPNFHVTYIYYPAFVTVQA
jgi:hypothetical protein